MDKIQKILRHPDFLTYVKANKKREKKRKFCKHNIAHFLNVARIGYLLVLEGGLPVSKEAIYAAALLHDIGRWRQYDDGTPHEYASAELAEPVLYDAGFSGDDITEIIDAILKHRSEKHSGGNGLRGVLFKADKLSRSCMFCKAESECDWAHKNAEIKI